MTQGSDRMSSLEAHQEDAEDDYDDLERRLSHVVEAEEDDNDQDLTEIAAPAPVSRTRSKRYSLEQEMSTGSHQRSHNTHPSNGEQFVTEVAAPPPVERSSTRHLQNTTATGAPADNTWEAEEDAQATSTGHVDQRSSVATTFYIYGYLVLFSIFGVLARLGVEAITTYPNAPVSSTSLWANVGGSLFLGFLTEDHRLFREEWGTHRNAWSSSSNDSDTPQEEKPSDPVVAHKEVKKTIPLYIGLTVGFCGCFTSFSSFLRDVFLALANHPAAVPLGRQFGAESSEPRNGGYSFEATMAVIIIQVATSVGAFITGAHCAMATDALTPTMPFKFVRRFVDPTLAVLGWTAWLGTVLLTIWPSESAWRGRVLTSVLFAPPGCLLRFHASKHLNSRIPSFPLGTFTVNIVGTIILGVCFDLQHSQATGGGVSGSIVACQILEGLIEGFCGSITTVSTWVAELTTLRRRHSYVYSMTSLVTALGFLVAIMGSVTWTRGFVQPACG